MPIGMGRFVVRAERCLSAGRGNTVGVVSQYGRSFRFGGGSTDGLRFPYTSVVVFVAWRTYRRPALQASGQPLRK